MSEAALTMAVISALLSLFSLAIAASRPTPPPDPGPPRSCATHGHRYEGRYHSEPTLKSGPGHWSADTVIRVARETATMTYVCDRCVYCGDRKSK